MADSKLKQSLYLKNKVYSNITIGNSEGSVNLNLESNQIPICIKSVGSWNFSFVCAIDNNWKGVFLNTNTFTPKAKDTTITFVLYYLEY